MLVALTVEVAAACPLKFPGSEVSRIGIYVENLSTGKIETAYNADMSFTPASVMKCITSATAQISLRPDFCFKTTVRPLGYIGVGEYFMAIYLLPVAATRHLVPGIFPIRKISGGRNFLFTYNRC